MAVQNVIYQNRSKTPKIPLTTKGKDI